MNVTTGPDQPSISKRDGARPPVRENELVRGFRAGLMLALAVVQQSKTTTAAEKTLRRYIRDWKGERHYAKENNKC